MSITSIADVLNDIIMTWFGTCDPQFRFVDECRSANDPSCIEELTSEIEIKCGIALTIEDVKASETVEGLAGLVCSRNA
jgi:hypothetical protein